MSKKFKAFTLYEKAWKADITFCVGPLDELKKYWDKRLKGNIDFSMYYDADGTASKLVGEKNNNTYRFLWIEKFRKNKPYDHGLLAHEAVHLGIQILEDKGIKVNLENEEALAYLVDRIVSYFYENI